MSSSLEGLSKPPFSPQDQRRPTERLHGKQSDVTKKTGRKNKEGENGDAEERLNIHITAHPTLFSAPLVFFWFVFLGAGSLITCLRGAERC